jgi:hypothetical protein
MVESFPAADRIVVGGGNNKLLSRSCRRLPTVFELAVGNCGDAHRRAEEPVTHYKRSCIVHPSPLKRSFHFLFVCGEREVSNTGRFKDSRFCLVRTLMIRRPM